MRKPKDVIRSRKIPRSTYLAVSYVFKDLIIREDNTDGVVTFTESEMYAILGNYSNRILFKSLKACGKDLKFLILAIRRKYKNVDPYNAGKFVVWFNEAKELHLATA